MKLIDTNGTSRMIIRGTGQPSRLDTSETRLALKTLETRLKKRQFAHSDHDADRTELISKGGDFLLLQRSGAKKAIRASQNGNEVILETTPYLPKPLLKLFDSVAGQIENLRPKA